VERFLYEETRIADHTALGGGSLVGVVPATVFCQVQSCDANPKRKNVSCAMISKTTSVMKTPVNAPKRESLRPTIDERN
jgi:hypothetical protein